MAHDRRILKTIPVALASRKFIRILLSMGLVSVLWFLSFGRASLPQPSESTTNALPLPLFINPSPAGVRERALNLLQQIAEQRASAPRAAEELARLGGAALPHVLPALDRLTPKARGYVALSLLPIAERMGLTAPQTADEAILFWNRFWSERATDFRPVVVKRWAARVAEHSLALGREDLIQLDTFALPQLIEELAQSSEEDTARIRRLSLVLAHVTGLPFQLGAESTPNAKATKHRWLSWWDEREGEFSTFEGIPRLTAILTETRYAKWLTSLLRFAGAPSSSATSGLNEVGSALLLSLLRLTAGLASGLGLGVLWTRLERYSSHWALGGWLLVTVLVTSFPWAVLAPWLHARAPELVLILLLAAAVTAAAAYRHQLQATWALRAGTEIELWAGALTASRLGLPALVSLLVALETQYSKTGIGPLLARALTQADVAAWMKAGLLLSMALLIVRRGLRFPIELLARRARTEPPTRSFTLRTEPPTAPKPARAVVALLIQGVLALVWLLYTSQGGPRPTRILAVVVLIQTSAFLVAVVLGSLTAAGSATARRMAALSGEVTAIFPSVFTVLIASSASLRTLAISVGIWRGLELAAGFVQDIPKVSVTSTLSASGYSEPPRYPRRVRFCHMLMLAAATPAWALSLLAALHISAWGTLPTAQAALGPTEFTAPRVTAVITFVSAATIFVAWSLIRTPRPEPIDS